MSTPIIVTGAAGFIGMHVAERLLDRGETVIGIDVFNAYYDPALKAARAARLEGRDGFTMVRMDIAEHEALLALVKSSGAKRVVHLAAQAGVRYSIDNPFAYERSNLAGHLAVLEACRHSGVEHLVYASSSSVYGDRPIDGAGFKETDPADKPVSLYAATKRSCEVISQSYAALYGFPQSGLRFFTVYGPWGRPDMAYYSFSQKIMSGEPIEVYGEGKMARDFTYIDDIVDGIIGVLDHPPAKGGHEVYNIGDNDPVGLMRLNDQGRGPPGQLMLAQRDEQGRGDDDPRPDQGGGLRDFVEQQQAGQHREHQAGIVDRGHHRRLA
jgi:UDP-glucuronate 4-epimerase